MTKQRKLIIVLAMVGGLVLLVVVARLGSKRGGVQVETSQVDARTIRSSILASGELQFKDPVELKPEVIGKISAIPVVEGQRVHKGQVVLRLDPELFQAQVAQQQAAVQQAQISIQGQKLTVANLQLQYTRQQQLYKQHLVDANSFDNLKNQLDLADSELQARLQALDIAQAQLIQSQQNLNKTVITSPLDGMITSLPVKVGETVITGTNIAGSTLMDIADPSEVLADVQVDEADIANVKLGEDANIDAVSFPDRTLHGKVQFVASSVTDTSNSLTASASQGRTFEVKIGIGDKDIGLLKPGMSARAEIFTQSTPGTLSVLVQAILYENDPGSKNLEPTSGAYVFLVTDGKAHKTPVTTGVSSDTYQAVTTGLKQGDTVVSGSYQTLHHLADGTAVIAAPAAATKSDAKKNPAMSADTVLELRAVTKRYVMGDAVLNALDGIDLSIKRNEYAAFIGPSGSGKSTLMNIVGCLDKPSSGEYILNGTPVAELDDNALARIRNREIGFIFQNFNLLGRSDALHNVMQPLIYRGIPYGERKRIATESLESVGLGERLHHLPNQLSGGQRQRVAIARALVGTPSILLADEPTGNLDSSTARDVMAMFDTLHQAGNTIIVVTHDPDIAAHCRRVIRIKDGKILNDTVNPDKPVRGVARV